MAGDDDASQPAGASAEQTVNTGAMESPKGGEMSPIALKGYESSLKAAFDQVDSNGNGQLDVAEVAEVLKLLDPDNPDRNQNFWNMMEQLDTNPPYGRVDWDEFREFMMSKEGKLTQHEFINPKWQERLKALSPSTSQEAVVPNQTVRHLLRRESTYRGTSEVLDAKQIPDEYEMGKKLGEGQFASVYLVKHNPTNRDLAMKVFFKEKLDALQVHNVIREANLMFRVDNHENVVKIEDLIETEQRLLVVMECVSGGHLMKKIIKEIDSFTVGNVARITEQLLDACAYMHEQGIVHCDLKPENVLCTKGGTDKFSVKITDFGLSKCFADDRADMNGFVGTPLYAAPEVVALMTDASSTEITDEAAFGPPADVWSIGCMMFQMLTGKPPFHNATDQKSLTVLSKGYNGFASAKFGRRESVQSHHMSKDLENAKVDELAIDLLARLLHPKVAPCQACKNAAAKEASASAAAAAAEEDKLEVLKGVKVNCPHVRITAEQALGHAFFSEQSIHSQSLASQLKTLSLTQTKIKMRRAVNKILFMRRIVNAIKASTGGSLVAAKSIEQVRRRSTAGGNGDSVGNKDSVNKGRGEAMHKDKGCGCNCSLQ